MSKAIVKPNATRRQAFKHGFLKGLGAPIMLFGNYELDSSIATCEFKPLPSRKRGSIAGDWRQVGLAIRSAVKKVG